MFTINLLGFMKYVLKINVIFTASPSMRGSTPLDVAAASVMDNNELALALREPDLEKVSSFFIKHFFPLQTGGDSCFLEFLGTG